MIARARLSARWLGPVGLCAAALFLETGCTTTRPDPGAEAAIALAAGAGEQVVFRIDGGPLDEPAAGVSLSMAEAVRRAVMTDPSLQAALARVRIAMADADQARLLPNPVLSLVLRWGPGKPQIEVSLAQDIVQALQAPRRADAADSRMRRAAADAVVVALDVVSEVQERYAAAQASAALVPLLQERMALLERLASVARSRLAAGEGTRSDVVTLEAQRVELRVEIDQAALAEREERLRLARLIGEPSSSAAWALDAWGGAGIDLPIESSWIEAALRQRPEIQSAVWKLTALGDEAALIRLLPWEGTGVGVDVQRDDEWFAGPSVSTPIPVFDTGQARRARVTAERIEARHELTLAQRTVVEEVRIAYQTATASTANLARIRSELIPLQEQRRTLAEDAYRAGQSDVTALFLAEHDLRLAQERAIEVERQAATALVRLQRAVGGMGVASAVMQGSLGDSRSVGRAAAASSRGTQPASAGP